MKITRKKTTNYKDKRVYVDEAGFDSYLFRKYARSQKGQKVHKAGKLCHKIIVPLEHNGIMYGDFFEVWFEAPSL